MVDDAYGGLGVPGSVVERTIQHPFARRADIYEAFLKLGCSLICRRFLEAA
jgi:hypothetical protein